MGWILTFSDAGALLSVKQGDVTPPPVVPPPPPPPPVEDASPFTFPPQPTIYTDDPSVRYNTIAGTADRFYGTGGFYTGNLNYPNPLPGQYLYAGMTPSGLRLWVPLAANPVWIRRVLALGHI